MSHPFEDYHRVAVAGGSLTVAQAGSPPDGDAVVVLAVHGITASHMAWRAIARELRGVDGVCLLAPDLRGRGGSAALPGPYGMAAHAADMLAVLDHHGTERALLVGHSMGCHIVARLAAEHPARAAGVVLLDGGLPSPALPGDWDPELETAAAPAGCCVVSEEAVSADSSELMLDGTTRTAIMRVRAPVRLVRARRGVFDDDNPMIARSTLDAFVAARPQSHIEDVAEVNHYTLMLGEGPGPRRAAAAIIDAVKELAPH